MTEQPGVLNQRRDREPPSDMLAVVESEALAGTGNGPRAQEK
jgi:hypothetical protein